MSLDTADVARSLGQKVPDLEISCEPNDLSFFGKDWTDRYPPDPCAICFPTNVDQVVGVVQWARENGVNLVPSGGRTGLSGGACATQGELVVSTEKMQAIEAFDPIDRQVRVQAGVTTEQLQEFARSKDLYYPVDFASKGSSQIGGNIATNAGGVHVLRYGMTRDWVAGLTVVTGTGEVLQLNRGLIKNATGLDMRHLFIGSEGMLGIIVEATMMLTDPPASQSVMVLSLPDMAVVGDVFMRAQRMLNLSAFEFFSDLAVTKVLERSELRRPLDSSAPYYALLEFDAADDAALEQALALFEDLFESELILDGVVSQSESQAAQFWAIRERISESISVEKPYKNDIAVMPSKVSAFLQQLDTLVGRAYPEFEVVWFGHIGDGNLHLNILKPADKNDATFANECKKVSLEVFALLKEFEGTISAEHGVGLLKRDSLSYSRSEGEIALMRGIKRLFDPDNILNPGKVLPEDQ